MDLTGQIGDEQTTKDTESHSNSHDSSQASEMSAEDERKMESECKTGRAFNPFPVILNKFLGAQWLSARVLDPRLRGCGFEPHRLHCVVVLEQDTFILA